MERPVITLVGGGAFAPRLCEVLAEAVDLPEVEINLTARRADRLGILARHSAARVATRRSGWLVRGLPSLEAACENASIVVLLVRVGGLEARAWDEEFPLRFGAVGDEGLGAGGISNAWRTLPELARIAAALECTAPGARILNLMAPLGITTRLLLERGLNAFGLCELPLVTLEAWLSRVGGSVDGASWHYGGLNHLGWFWNFRFAGKDVLQVLADSQAPGAPAPIDRITLEKYEAAPLRYFYEVFDQEAAARLGIARRSNRARHLIEISESLIERFSRQPGIEVGLGDIRPTPWLDRAVAPVAAALLGGPIHHGFVNLQNGMHLPELPPDVVVEVAATFTSRGVSSVVPGALPDRVAQFLRPLAQSDLLTYQAALERNSRLLEDAIRALPYPISDHEVRQLAALAKASPPTRDRR